MNRRNNQYSMDVQFFGNLKIFTGLAVGLEHLNLDNSGNILLPPSILAHLANFPSDKPMLFALSHNVTNLTTCTGVLEFSAQEGSVVAPSWVLDQIGVECGDTVFVQSAILPVGEFARFQPMSSNFLHIHDQKAVLEKQLRHFACLSSGDIIPIEYNGETFLLSVVNTEPNDAICIRNCDLEVDIDNPVGYKPSTVNNSYDDFSNDENFSASTSSAPLVVGYRLNGEKVEYEQCSGNLSKPQGIPDYDWKFGTLNFFRKNRNYTVDNVMEKFDNLPFPGTGRSLK